MNTLSITSTKTMAYDATAALQSFAIVEKLVSFTGTVMQSTRKMWCMTAGPALRVAHA